MSSKDADAITFVRQQVYDALWSVTYHEEALSNAHRKLAAATAMIRRGNYTEFTLDEIRKEVEAKRAEQKEQYEEDDWAS